MSKKKSSKPKRPKIIVEKTYFDEDTGRVTIREWNANAKSNPPKKKQIAFQDPYEDGAIFIDWSKDAEKALTLAGVKFDIIDFGKEKAKTLRRGKR